MLNPGRDYVRTKGLSDGQCGDQESSITKIETFLAHQAYQTFMLDTHLPRLLRVGARRRHTLAGRNRKTYIFHSSFLLLHCFVLMGPASASNSDGPEASFNISAEYRD